MSFIRASKVRTNALGQLLGSQQAISFDHLAFGMNPFGFDRIEPGAFGGQKAGQNAHALALLLDEEVMLSNPGPHQLARMKRGVIPDEQPASLALRLQLGATPLQKLGGDGTHRSPIHKAQRHLATGWIGCRTLLPKDPITGEGFWVRIILLPGLLDQTKRMIFALPGLRPRQREPAPPHFIGKSDGPARLRARPSDQAVACRFFLKY